MQYNVLVYGDKLLCCLSGLVKFLIPGEVPGSVPFPGSVVLINADAIAVVAGEGNKATMT